ncbi:iron ABC transporter permease [Halocynthiibacter sp. C4]|uniref:ABC transporter permease n=1 Tax=Halocynthiibacter sp. C4 TaxID=2992758 RepID=UPI00237A3D5C|nr:iron ABC transporter permease [Halocynthiibacter sp. C4]MDE0590028.1 iron ABC transporter permease [Halocynthiibacter sp. C4]
MTTKDTNIHADGAKTRLRPDLWSIGALLIALTVAAPIVAVVWIAFHPTENIWPHLMATTLPRYLTNTLVLMISVGTLSAAVGTGAAWLTTMYLFPGVRWFQWLLLLPLAVPAYLGAYGIVDFLEYAGPVQTLLRDVMGYTNGRDYWFPQVRSMGSAIVVLTAALSPYVFLLARAAFREHSGGSYEVARALGAGPFKRFWKVGVPLARPAIAAGVAIVMMETASDFGAVDFFAVQTLTTGIFTTWLESSNAGGAAQIAGVVLILVLLLVSFEKILRRKNRYHNAARQTRQIVPIPLRGYQGWLASFFCFVPFAVGFLLPAGVLTYHAFTTPGAWQDRGLTDALVTTLAVGASAAVITVIAACFLVYGVRLARSRLPRMLLPVTTLGYAAPGAVLGVGILIPMAAADHALADFVEATTGLIIGLLMTGTGFAIVFAYSVRFFAIAQGAVDSAMGRVAPSLPLAARSLGQTAGGALRRVYLPLIRGSIGTALLLVFVDCVKELPATLLLRPFNFNTLATRVYEQAALENLEMASPAAVLVMLVSLCAVLLMARTNASK